MKTFIQKYKLNIVSALTIMSLVAYSLIVSGLRYETNDDATLSNIANGAFGSNSQDLIYINIFLSCFIKLAHTAFPTINFVVFIQLALVFISLYFIVLVIEEKFGIVTGTAISIILFLPFSTELISKFQYVKTSTIIITAGLILIATNLSKTNIRMFIGYFLVIMGCQIRFESFISTGALCAFTLLYYFFNLSRKDKVKACVQMILMFTIVFSLEIAHNLYYTNTPEWKEFTLYNSARTQLSDYKENYIPLYFEQVMERGFSENDVQMLYSRNFFDNSVFDIETINKASAAVGPKPIKNIIADYLHIVLNLSRLLGEKFYRIGFVFSVILFIASNRKSKVYQFCTFVMFSALLMYLMIVNRFMGRIEAMLIIALAVNILIVHTPAKVKNKSTDTAVILFMIAVILFNLPVQVSYQKGKYISYTEESKRYENTVIQMSSNKDNLYLFDPVQTDCFAGYDIFNPRPKDFFSNICPTGSWYSNSVYTNSVLEEFGLHSPLIDSVNKPNIYISNEFIDIKLKYVQEHFNKNVYCVKITDNGLCDYQFRMD